MKKNWVVIAAVALLASCGNSDSKTAGTTGDAAGSEKKTVDLSSNPDYQKGIALISNNDCLGCHKIDDVLTGPSYKQVAQKYADQSGAIVDTLAQRIITGHTGVWGDQVMTAHPNLSEADAKTMVRYILLLNQQ